MYKAAYDLLRSVRKKMGKIPHDAKYILAEVLKGDLTEITVMMYRTNATTGRLSCIGRTRDLVVGVRVRLRLLQGIRHISVKWYAAFAQQAGLLSKQSSAWYDYVWRRDTKSQDKIQTRENVNKKDSFAYIRQDKASISYSRDLRERIRRIFGECDYAHLSFSGGRDSGVLLSACVEHIRQHGGWMRVLHMDYEVQYSPTTEYIDEMLSSNRGIPDAYRCCMPLEVGSAMSMYQRFWRPQNSRARQVREMSVEYQDTEAFDFYIPQMWDYELQERSSFWLREQLGM